MAKMLSLLDVLPRHERVGIGGDQYVDVFGISGEDLGKILDRFPDAFVQMIDMGERPLKMNAGLMGALLAASQRNGGEESLLGDDVVEQRARTLAVGAQVKMLLAMGRCTFPDGMSPFLDDYMSMSSAALGAISIVVEVASKAPATKSPPTPNPSEPPDTQASGG
jgi:hypothetical protein